MSAILSKLFKPKWQHPNPHTRLVAVRRLQADDAKQRDILLQVARQDSSVDVRMAALEKLDDPRLMQELLQQTQDALLQDAVRQRFAALLAGTQPPVPPLEERLNYLSQLSDPQLFRLVTATADNLELRLQALQRIDDEALLTEIACDNTIAKVRITAAERLTQAEHLEHLARCSKGKDKRVNRIARDALSALRADAAARAEQQRQREAILEALQVHARTGFTPMFKAKLQHLTKQWKQIEGIASTEDCARYQQAVQACEQILAEQEAREQAEREQARQEAVLRQQQEAICENLQNKWHSLCQQLPDSQQVSALRSQLNLQQQHWDELSQQQLPAAELLKRFQQLREQLVTALTALDKLQAQHEELDQFAREALALDLSDNTELQRARKRLKQLLQQIQWPDSLPMPAVLAQAADALNHVQDLNQTHQQNKQQALTDVRAQLKQLERHIEAGEIQPGGQLLKRLQQQSEQLPNDSQAKVEPKLRQLHARLSELRDWQGFATAPKREELCQTMEALIEDSMEPPQKAERIKALQQEWKALGSAGGSRELWERFRAAADKAYEPCRAYFAQEAEQRHLNLEQRKKICQQLQQFIDGADWDKVDPQAVDEILQRAKQEWRSYSPVNRAPGKSVQQQFNQLLDQLHEVLDRYRARNAEQKQAIIDQASDLLEDTDLRAATDTAKQLQQQWREIGPAPRSQEKRLWKTFRGICDELFGKRDALWQAQQQEREQNHEQAEELIRSLENLTRDEARSTETKAPEVKQLQERFNQLGPLPKQEVQSLRERFNTALEQFQASHQQEAEQAMAAQWQEMARKAELCEQLEQSLLQGQPVATESLETAWKTDIELPKRDAKALNQRWQRALQAAHNQDISKLQSLQEQQLQTRRQLCVQMETLAGVETPEQDQPLRMEYQVSRLSQGLGQQRSLSNQEEARQIQAAWYASGPVDSSQARAYTERFSKACQALFG